MANAENRPFSGTWTYNNKKNRRHVPDCIVTFNGETAMPSCTGCTGQIDLQDLITSVSVTNSTDTSPASVSLGMEIPTNRRSCFFRDNKFILHTGIEIHVYMRGYFTHSELGGNTEDENYNLQHATMKPYYQVFNGVITEVSHGFSGGFYSLSLSAVDFLHFWQYQSIATNPSHLGAGADGNKTHINFTGHKYTRKNPFSVVHELYSSGHGDAGDHAWVLSDFQNIGIKSDLYQASFWEVTGWYWAKRFQQPMGNLKMYGTDGRLFNSFEQFLLSSDLIGKGEASMTSDKWSALENPKTDVKRLGSMDTYMDTLLTVLRHSHSKDGEVNKQQYAFPSSSLFYVENTTWVAETAKGKGARGYNVAGVTAFALDISSLGQVNLFESQMQTKMDIASQVSTEIGYEFFIDFNGDYVFKPPFYNLDPSDNRVYVVKDIDLISFDSNESEPECTVMKGTGGYFNNMASLFGKEFENRGMFIDWRGVAKYGWREASFETTFLNDPRSIYYAAMNRMAIQNKDVNSGSCTIPLRPEMKLGFPVYIEPFDVFYYVTGISHTFGYGSDCTTSLTLTAKRAKFFPPMDKQGRFPKLEEVNFKNIYLPSHALFSKNGQGQPKYMGFPCVVMGLDMSEVNPLWFIYGEITNFLVNMAGNTKNKSVGGNHYEGLLTLVRSLAEIERGLRWEVTWHKDGDKTYKVNRAVVRVRNGDEVKIPFSRIVTAAKTIRKSIEDRIDEKDWHQYERGNGAFLTQDVENAIRTGGGSDYGDALVVFFKILDKVRSQKAKGMQHGTNMEHYLASLKYMKTNFRPDDQQPGVYRYYSSAFPNDSSLSPTFQGMSDRTDVNIDSFAKESLSGLSVNVVHEVESPEPRVKVFDMGDGTYEIVNPADLNDTEIAKYGGTEAFKARYGIPVRHFVYTDESKGETYNGKKKVFKVFPTEDIKTLVFSVQFLGRKSPQKFDINATVTVDKTKPKYSLPDPETDNFPTGVLCSDVYQPFIDSHIEAMRIVGQRVSGILRTNDQVTRQGRWDAFLSGLEADFEKIKRTYRRTWSYTFTSKRKQKFKNLRATLSKKMTEDLFTLVRYLNITEVLARSDHLSNVFNNETGVIDKSAQMDGRRAAFGADVVGAENVLQEDMNVLKEINRKIKSMISMTELGSTPKNERYEYLFLLNAWEGHPCFSSTPATRKKELDDINKQRFSYFSDCLKENTQQIFYRFRKAGEEAYYSPVIPVSDEKGFEVFGHYAYGRGLNLKTLAEIIDTPADAWADLSPLDLNRLYGNIASKKAYKRVNGKRRAYRKLISAGEATSGSVLQDNYSAFDKNYRTTINEAMAKYIATTGASNILDPDLIEVTEANGVDLSSSDEVFTFLQTWSNASGSTVGMRTTAAMIFEQAFVQNIITTNQQYGQSIAAENVPIELARLDQFYSPTSCTGGAANALSTSDAFMLESDQYSFAYNSNTGEFNETAWQQMLAENRVIDWFTHQEALRGTISEDNGNFTDIIESIIEDGSAVGDAFTQLANDIQSVPDAFNQLVVTPDKGLEATQSSSLPSPTINEEDE